MYSEYTCIKVACINISCTNCPVRPSCTPLSPTNSSSIDLKYFFTNIVSSQQLLISKLWCTQHFHNLVCIICVLSFSYVLVCLTIIHAFITSILDYSNSLLSGISKKSLSRLQLIQNSAARIWTQARKHDHTNPGCLALAKHKGDRTFRGPGLWTNLRRSGLQQLSALLKLTFLELLLCDPTFSHI